MIDIAFIFDCSSFSKSSLDKKLLNIYLIKIDERDTNAKTMHHAYSFIMVEDI